MKKDNTIITQGINTNVSVSHFKLRPRCGRNLFFISRMMLQYFASQEITV
jgi:hypothetical protein